ncbi:NB-ARC domain-containing protein [Leptothoe sp. EHU-05/26/07-4]
MGQSVRASEKGLAIANQARQRRGWTKTSTARWWQDAHTSRATLRRFWRGERIQQEAFIAICQTVGLEHWQEIAEEQLPEASQATPSSPTVVDWGDAPDIEQFYGRDQELQQLQEWVLEDQTKLVNISGLGGSGKTTLALALAEQLQPEFTGVIWRSVGSLLSLETLLGDLLDAPIETVDQGVKQLRKKMQQERWLIILDNFTAYLDFLYQITGARHQSCVLVISHDPLPSQFQTLNRVQSLSLPGLSPIAAVQLLESCGCGGHPHQLKALARLYGHNPLALKLISLTIKTTFGGQLTQFLEQGSVILTNPIRQPLIQQFNHLTGLEKTIVFWLAIWQEPISLCRLQTHLLMCEPGAVIESLSKLVAAALITRHFLADEPAFSLQPMVMAFVIEKLVQKILEELSQAQQQDSIQPFQLLRSHCLLRPGTDDILGDRILSALQSAYRQRPQIPSLCMESWLGLAKAHYPNNDYLVFNLTILATILDNNDI